MAPFLLSNACVITLFALMLTLPCSSQSSPTAAPSISYIDNNCSAEFSSMGSTFDLCPLTLGSQSGQLKFYRVLDSLAVNTSTTTMEYTYYYYFNIGGELAMPPPICHTANSSHKYCPQGKDCSLDNNTIEMTDNAWAYQVRINATGDMDACWVIGRGPAEWRLFDEEDPSLGVSLTYINGDYDDSVCGKNREFIINFGCEDNIRFIPDEIPLYENEPCEYTLSVPSQYGCPVECKTYDNKLCAENGLCGYDNSNQASHCFCYYAYSEDDCSAYDDSASFPDSAQKATPSGLAVFEFNDANTNGVDVVYDLRPFGAPEGQAAQNGGVYIVHDKSYESYDRRWTYYVSVTRPIRASSANSVLPDYCHNISAPCNDVQPGGVCNDDTVNDPWNGADGLVFQTNNVTKECFVLGRFTTNSPRAVLYDTIDDPARGVTLVYDGGSWCSAAGINRQFKVNLVCPRDQSALFDPYTETAVSLYEYVEEEDICVYAFTMESAVACPYQCITNGTDEADPHAFTVCSQKGICAADPEAGFVRCLCDDGWTGVYCSQIDSPMPTLQPTGFPTAGAMVIHDTEVIHETEVIYDTEVIHDTKVIYETEVIHDTKVIYEHDTSHTTPAEESNTVHSQPGSMAVIVILAVVILVVFVVGYFVYRNQKIRISQQEDEIAFHKMSDQRRIAAEKETGISMEQDNIVTDSHGKNAFATLRQQDIDEDGEDAHDL